MYELYICNPAEITQREMPSHDNDIVHQGITYNYIIHTQCVCIYVCVLQCVYVYYTYAVYIVQIIHKLNTYYICIQGFSQGGGGVYPSTLPW